MNRGGGIVRNKYTLRILYTAQEVSHSVERIGKRISKDYSGKTPLLLGALKGSFIFLADLCRAIEGINMNIDFYRIESYPSGTSPLSTPKLIQRSVLPLREKDVIIVEDIIDSGRTLRYLIQHIEEEHPSSIRVCALIDKRERREEEVEVHYRGFSLDEGFVVGYGMDISENYRNLGDIFILHKRSNVVIPQEDTDDNSV